MDKQEQCSDVFASGDPQSREVTLEVKVKGRSRVKVDVFCLFNGDGSGFVFVARDVILNSIDNPFDLDLLSKDRSKVLIRVLKEDGVQEDTVIKELDLYNDRNLTLMVNEHTGFARVKNRDSMGDQFVYLGILDLETAGQVNSKQGFVSNGQEVSFTNCDGNPNNYFVFYAQEEIPMRGSQGSLLVSTWRESAVLAAPDRLLPLDRFTYLIELHFGGCGAFETSNNWRGVLGGAFGLPFTYSSCGYPGRVDGASRNVTGVLFGDHVVYKCRRGYHHVTGNLTRECTPDRGWTGETPVCERVKCSVPTLLPEGTHLTVNPPDGDYGGTLVGRCLQGWSRRKGRRARRCMQTGRWSGKPLVCKRISCDKPDTVPFSRVKGKSYLYEDVLAYSCRRGYHNVGGTLSRTCTSGGNWTGETPVCERVSCGHPGNISQGEHLGNSYLYDDTVTYFCHPGFITSDEVILRCTAAGTWDMAAPTCQRVSCGHPGNISNGEHSSVSYLYEDVITYFCDPGYITSDNVTRRCTANGTWDGQLPTCQRVSCGHPGNISHGEHLGVSYLYDDTVTYFCHPGYVMPDDVTLRCTANGTYDIQPPTCERVSCGEPEIIFNGEHSGMSYLYEDVVTYFCDPGYVTSDNVIQRCTADGTWEGQLPTCERLSCGRPRNISHGEHVGVSHLYQDVLIYYCYPGYVTSDNLIVRCGANGTWDGQLPTCQRVYCGHPGHISHGEHLGVSYLYDDTVTYFCHPGYVTPDDVTLRCTAEGTWDVAAPTCQRLSCSVPPEVDYARWAGEASYKDSIVYTCNYGYHITSGEETLHCSEKGDWSGEPPVCERMSCGHPGNTSDGSHQGESYLFDDVITYACHPGHVTPDDVTLTCLANGTWDKEPPSCERLTCRDPPQVKDAQWTGEDRYLDSIVYTCNHGYHVTSDEVRLRCNKHGNWSGEPPVCERVSCGDPGPVANAHYSGSYLYEDQVLYVCEDGFFFAGGDAILVCHGDRRWQGKRIVCEEDKNPSNVPVFCSPAPEVKNATWPASEDYLVPVNTLVSYTCDEHHEFSNGESRKSIVCLGSGQWNKDPGHCDLKRCPPLPNINHGHVDRADPVIFSWHVTSCDVGHVFPDGSRVRSVYCKPDKTWSSVADDCKPIPCPEVEAPPHVTKIPPEVNQTKPSDDHYACPEGARSEIGTEVQVTSCGSKGLWARPLTNCTAESCFAPPMVDNATLVQYGVHVGASAHFRCRRGSRFPSGLETHEITCLGRDWDETVVQPCSVTNCPVPPDVPDATLHAADYFYSGTLIRYDCHYGYRFAPGIYGKVLECLASGVWDQEVGRCQQILCPDVEDLTGGSTNTTDRTVDTEVTVTCPQGQRFLRGQRSLNVTCMLIGQWSHLPDTCREARCPPVPDVSNALYSTLVADRGTMVRVTCLPGYRLPSGGGGGYDLMCGADDSWEGTLINCTAVYCGPAPSLPLASTNQTGSYFGDSAVLSCFPGYQFEDGVRDLDLHCQQDSSWSLNLTNLSCQPLHCPPIPYVGNATPSAVNTMYNTTMTYTCLHGYWSPWDKSHYVTTRCNESGHWEPKVHNCLEIQCPPVPVWLPIIPSSLYRRFATLLNYTCPVNTTFTTGELWRLANCTITGEWLPHILPCIDIPDNTTIPPKEAEGSGAIGTFAIVMVSVVFGSILLLDILTLQKDLHILKENLSYCLPCLAEPNPNANGECQRDNFEMIPLMTNRSRMYSLENNTSGKSMMAAFDHPDVKLFHGSSSSGLVSVLSGEFDYPTVCHPPSGSASVSSFDPFLTKSPVILKPHRLLDAHGIPYVEGGSADTYLSDVSTNRDVDKGKIDISCPLADEEAWDEEIDYPLSVYDIHPEMVTSIEATKEDNINDNANHTAAVPDYSAFTIAPIFGAAENGESSLSGNTEAEEEDENSPLVREKLQNGTTSALSGSPL